MTRRPKSTTEATTREGYKKGLTAGTAEAATAGIIAQQQTQQSQGTATAIDAR